MIVFMRKRHLGNVHAPQEEKKVDTTSLPLKPVVLMSCTHDEQY